MSRQFQQSPTFRQRRSVDWARPVVLEPFADAARAEQVIMVASRRLSGHVDADRAVEIRVDGQHKEPSRVATLMLVLACHDRNGCRICDCLYRDASCRVLPPPFPFSRVVGPLTYGVISCQFLASIVIFFL